jgi:hypothetical protein
MVKEALDLVDLDRNGASAVNLVDLDESHGDSNWDLSHEKDHIFKL